MSQKFHSNSKVWYEWVCVGSVLKNEDWLTTNNNKEFLLFVQKDTCTRNKSHHYSFLILVYRNSSNMFLDYNSYGSIVFLAIKEVYY